MQTLDLDSVAGKVMETALTAIKKDEVSTIEKLGEFVCLVAASTVNKHTLNPDFSLIMDVVKKVDYPKLRKAFSDRLVHAH
jgi:hypothetical protein